MRAATAAVILLLLPTPVLAWGLAAHAMITRDAVERTPPALRDFLRANRSLLVDRTLEPDTVLRDRLGPREARRHYLNLEVLSTPPFTDIPDDARAARARYGPSRMRRAGCAPWATEQVYRGLVATMRERNRARTLELAGHLAHYVQDAHSPLHSTVNYDGRRTGNDGIHALYESKMIQRRAKFFRELGPDTPVPEQRQTQIAARILGDLREGHRALRTLFDADRKARDIGEPGSAAYLDALFRQQGSAARDQMREAARETAAFWTGAWIEAGKPRL